MRTRWTAATGFVMLALALLSGAGAAVATPPVTLSAGFVTDSANVLSPADESAINTRLEELSNSQSADLFVVFVDDFTDPTDRQAWANQVANDNGLGPSQYLLAVSTEGRQYYISAHSEGPLSESRVAAIEESIKPALRDGNWAGAVMTAADGFEGTGAASSGGSGWVPVLIFVALATVAVIVIVAINRRKKKSAAQVESATDPYAQLSDEELATRAGSALVNADDAITSSREELGFAIAQFGNDATASFAQVIADAKAQVDQAFSIKQQLDDEVPDSDEQRRTWRIQIIQLCEAADNALESNLAAFDELRKLEQNAEDALQLALKNRESTAALIAAAPAALDQLTKTYDASALSTVADNPAQATSRLQLADSHLAEAQQLLTAGTRGEAAFAIRTAEEALVQGAQLAVAITTLGNDLAASEEQARALMADLEGDVAATASLPDPSGELAQIAAATRAQLDEARTNLSGSARKPQIMLEALTAANTRIDSSIAQTRDAQQRAARASQLLEQAIMQAQARISAANEFITTRRGAVGSTARTRLSSASNALARADGLRLTDPEAALQHAQQADSLAQQAITSAQQDVSGFGGMGGGYSNGGSSNSGLGGDILGGIIGGILAGGLGGGSSSGSSRRSSGGSWRSSGGSRSFRPSSFGGSRGRSGGGRF